MGVSFWVLLPLCGLASGLIGLLVSLPTLRLQGIYLSIVTLGASEIIRIVAQTWTPVTGGAMGIKGIPYPWLYELPSILILLPYMLLITAGFAFADRKKDPVA